MIPGYFKVVLGLFIMQNILTCIFCIVAVSEKDVETKEVYTVLAAISAVFISIAAYGIFTYTFRALP